MVLFQRLHRQILRKRKIFLKMFPCRAVQGQKSFLEQIAAQKRRLISLRGSAGKVMGAGRIFPGIVAVGSGQLIIHKVGDGELHRSRPGSSPGKILSAAAERVANSSSLLQNIQPRERGLFRAPVWSACESALSPLPAFDSAMEEPARPSAAAAPVSMPV